ncbi:intersectin-1-like [Gossypium hirsutum]|uniref:Intersectin-1-like n=1 Tax=Gossypium hirsutum TaxID=3635 RepID=A0A1U8P7I3_GOSHI|nr:intersectin-1-like [Gossypium hirsutum]
MSEQWIAARIKEKGESKYISWDALKDLIMTHPDETKKVDVFALSFHFRLIDRVICRVFFEDYSPLRDIVASTRRVDVLEENWMAQLQNLQSKDVEWRAPCMTPGEVLGADYKRKVSEVSSAWKKTCRLKGVAISPATTPKYVEWRGRRLNDNIPRPSMEGARPIEEYLQVMPSELEIMKQEFERKSLEFEKRDGGREREERKEEDRDDLKEHYKRAQVSLRRARVGGSSDQLQKEVQEEKARAESLRWHQNHNSTVKLKELKSKVEDLEVALHDGELRVEQLKAQEDYLKGELHQAKGQVRERDHVIGEAIAQIREVAEYVQDLAIRADVLSLMYSSSSDIGREFEQLQKDMQDQMQEQLVKMQNEMREQMLEAQRNMMTEMTQLLRATDKGKVPMAITEEENEGPPPGFTPPHVPLQTEAPPRRPSVTVRPQHGPVDAEIPVNFPSGLGNNLGDS